MIEQRKADPIREALEGYMKQYPPRTLFDYDTDAQAKRCPMFVAAQQARAALKLLDSPAQAGWTKGQRENIADIRFALQVAACERVYCDQCGGFVHCERSEDAPVCNECGETCQREPPHEHADKALVLLKRLAPEAGQAQVGER